MTQFCDPIWANIPSWNDWIEAERWLKEGLHQFERLSELGSSPPVCVEENWVVLDWIPVQDVPRSPFGHYPSVKWQKFVLSVYLADLLSYLSPPDQVNFERLLFVMHSFPQGFKVWFLRMPDGTWWPAGYSGWYPISETTFELFEKFPEKIRDRLVAPMPDGPERNSHLYLFNYSAHSSCKGTGLTRALLKDFSSQLSARPYAGLCTITVSEEGARVARRFGLSSVGEIKHPERSEQIYVTPRFALLTEHYPVTKNSASCLICCPIKRDLK